MVVLLYPKETDVSYVVFTISAILNSDLNLMLKSEILKVACDTYKEIFGGEAKIRAIHAGLECGLFLEKYPHLEMVSFGPTLRGVHSPDERLEIATVDKFWRLLVEVVSTIQ